MSTYWYPFRKTISSVRLEKTPGHDILHVWQRGGKCGSLTLDQGTGEAISELFIDSLPAFHVWNDAGTVKIKKCEGYRPESTYLMSEYGDLLRIEEVVKLGKLEEQP